MVAYKKPKFSHDEHITMQSTFLCPNCAVSILMCPCRVIQHGKVGMHILALPKYLEWRAAQFQAKFGIAVELARKQKQPKSAMLRALRNLDVIARKAEKWRLGRVAAQSGPLPPPNAQKTDLGAAMDTSIGPTTRQKPPKGQKAA